jgi:hypothetical protein
MGDKPERLQFDIRSLLIFIAIFAVLVTASKTAGAFATPSFRSLQDALVWLGTLSLVSAAISIKVNEAIRR